MALSAFTDNRIKRSNVTKRWFTNPRTWPDLDEIQASVLLRRSSHLQPCQPHVTCYTALHRVQSVGFSGLLHQLFTADYFSVRPSCLVASLPISVIGWWLAKTRPPTLLALPLHHPPPLPPSALCHTSSPYSSSSLFWDYLPGSFSKCDGCAGGPNETPRHPAGASALTPIGWSASLKCWVIFSKEALCSFSGEFARIDAGVTWIRWRGDTIVAFGKVVQHQNRWASFQAPNGNWWLWNQGQ